VKVIVYCDLLATIFSGKVERTSAVEVISEVYAGRGWGTGARGAVIDVDFAILSLISIRT
jgi:hypothetical protein